MSGLEATPITGETHIKSQEKPISKLEVASKGKTELELKEMKSAMEQKRGLQLMNRKRFKEALDCFLKTMDENDKGINGQTLMFSIICDLKMRSKTLEVDDAILRQNAQLAIDLMDQGDFKGAANKFELILTVDPKNKIIPLALLMCNRMLCDQAISQGIGIAMRKKTATIEMKGDILGGFDKQGKRKPLPDFLQPKFKAEIQTEEGIREKMAQSLPYFTTSLEWAASAIRNKNRLAESGLDFKTAGKPDSFAEAFNLINAVDAGITALARQGFLAKTGEEPKESGVSLFLAYLGQIPLKPDEKKGISDFMRARGDILSVVYPERQSSFWDMMRAEEEGYSLSKIGGLEKKPVRIHSREKMMLGLSPMNALYFAARLEQMATDPMIKELAGELRLLLLRYRETGFTDKKRLGEVAQSLKAKIPLSPPDTTPEEFKALSDLYGVMQNKEESLLVSVKKINPQYALKHLSEITQNKEIGELAKDLAELLQSVNAGGGFPKKKDENDFKKKTDELERKLSGITPSNVSEMEYEIIRDVLTRIKNRKMLLASAAQIDEEDLDTAMEEGALGDKSIDPKVEFVLDMVALDNYTEAIRLNPSEEKNYEALFRFFDKIHFDGGSLKRWYEKRLKEKMPPEKIAEGLKQQIRLSIEMKMSLYPPPQKRRKPEKEFPKTPMLPITFYPMGPSMQQGLAGMDTGKPWSGNMREMPIMPTISIEDPEMLLNYILRKLK